MSNVTNCGTSRTDLWYICIVAEVVVVHAIFGCLVSSFCLQNIKYASHCSFFRTDRKYGVNNGGSIGSSSSGLGSSGGLLSGDSEGASDSARIKRENILSELLVTESKYASDLQQVLRNYR